MEGGVQDYHPRLEEYCKLHPYFERSVRHFVNMFRYIPYSEVLDTLDFLLHDRFWDIMVKDLEDGITYIFISWYQGKSGYYFTHLFVDMIKKELDIKYHNLIRIHYGLVGMKQEEAKFKYIIVDDASYSGVQMEDVMEDLPPGELYIILVAASEEAIQKIKSGRRDSIDMFIGSIYTNPFTITAKDLYLNWDIIYETDGQLHSLLGIISVEGSSCFYFQHKLPDDISIPVCLLRGLRNPSKVDRILTREDKEKLIPNPGWEYYEDIDNISGSYKSSSEGFFPLVDDVKPFYKK